LRFSLEKKMSGTNLNYFTIPVEWLANKQNESRGGDTRCSTVE
jgi:hypothetical protein